MPWKKGQSGNPAGRKRVADSDTAKRMMARARAGGPEAIALLIKVMRTSPRPSEQVAAACAILDRGFGRPMQSVDIASIRSDLKKHLGEIVAGSPGSPRRVEAAPHRDGRVRPVPPD